MSSHYTSVITDGFYYTRLFHLYYLTSCMWPLGAKIFCLLLLLLLLFLSMTNVQKISWANQIWRCQINIFRDKSTIHPAPGVHGRGSDLAGKLLVNCCLGYTKMYSMACCLRYVKNLPFNGAMYDLLIKSSTRAAQGKPMASPCP